LVALLTNNFLLGFRGGLSGGDWCSGGGGSCGSVADDIVHVASLEGLGEEAGPVSFDRVCASANYLVQFLFSDFELTVVEEESSISANEFVFLGFGEGRYLNVCHISYLIIYNKH
jgi:hypothetical protein